MNGLIKMGYIGIYLKERKTKVGCRRKIGVFDKFCENWQHFLLCFIFLSLPHFLCRSNYCKAVYWQSSSQNSVNSILPVDCKAIQLKENYNVGYEHGCYHIPHKRTYFFATCNCAHNVTQDFTYHAKEHFVKY